MRVQVYGNISLARLGRLLIAAERNNTMGEIRGQVKVGSLAGGVDTYAIDGTVNTVRDAVEKYLKGEDISGFTIRRNNEMSTQLDTPCVNDDFIMVFASAKVAAEGIPGAS